MCLALPADNAGSKRQSRITAPVCILFGGTVFVALLFVSLIGDRLARNHQ